MIKSLFIRLDADKKTGRGHLMRCLALAQAWKEAGGKVTFLLGFKSKDVSLEKRLRAEGMDILYIRALTGSIRDANATIRSIEDKENSWLILDGYRFDAKYQKAIEKSGINSLCVDDMGHVQGYYTDLVVNQNLSASKALYKNISKKTKLLLGPRFAPLRRVFWKWRGWKRTINTAANRILIIMGGSDLQNITLQVIQSLKNIGILGLEALVVIGPTNANGPILKKAMDVKNIKFRYVKDPVNMPELMAWADICISAGGITCLETAFMGLPTLVLVTADNQEKSARKLHQKGAVKNLGKAGEMDLEGISSAISSILRDVPGRKKMSRIAQALVDGCGAQRVIRAMSHYQKRRI